MPEQKASPGIVLELRRSIAWMDLVMANLSEGVAVINENDHVTFVNDSFAALIEKQRIFLLGLSIWEILPELQHKVREWESSRTGTGYLKIDDYCFRSSGRLVTLELVVTDLIPVIHQRIIVLRDITERKKLEKKILSSEKFAAIGRLAAEVGHELRNPLGAIKNALYYVRDALEGTTLAQQNPSLLQFIHLADKEVENSAKIINELLDFSKVAILDLSLTDLNELLLEALTIIEIPKNVKVIKKFCEFPKVMVDPIRIRQIFANLANNAIQAMPKGGELTIVTRLEDPMGNQDGFAQIIFKDTGLGIAKENLHEIFEPLFSTKAKGSGLGLAICKQIAETHGGEILVESEEKKGSTFILRIPLSRSSKKDGENLNQG